jgi:hypothetical protein
MELNPVSPSDSRTMVTGMAKSHGNFQRLVQRHERSIDEVEKITLPQWPWRENTTEGRVA